MIAKADRSRRVIVIGGDSRVHRVEWPPGVDVRTYDSNRANVDKVLDSALRGGADDVVVLARWINHSAYRKIKSQSHARVFTWDRGIPELARGLTELLGLPAAAAAPAPSQPAERRVPRACPVGPHWWDPATGGSTSARPAAGDDVEELACSAHAEELARSVGAAAATPTAAAAGASDGDEPAGGGRRRDLRGTLLSAMRAAGRPLGGSEVNAALGAEGTSSVGYALLKRMVARGEVVVVGSARPARYALAVAPAAAPAAAPQPAAKAAAAEAAEYAVSWSEGGETRLLSGGRDAVVARMQDLVAAGADARLWRQVKVSTRVVVDVAE